MNIKWSMSLALGSLFCVCLFLGRELSAAKPLWNDELYTQKYTIESSSWLCILEGKTVEGSNAPLYYLLQKGIESAMQYHLPFSWHDFSDGRINHLPSQALLRASSDIFISISVVLIVWYFWVNVS